MSEFLVALEKSIGVRESSLSGFALFADDPAASAVEHCLQASAKVVHLGWTYLPTALMWQVMQLPPSVRPSACFHSIFRSN